MRSCLSRVVDASELGAGIMDGVDGMSFVVASFPMLFRCIHELVCKIWMLWMNLDVMDVISKF